MITKSKTERRRKLEIGQQGDAKLIAASPGLPVPIPPPSFLRQLWNKVFEDEVFGRAAQLAYYWLFSLFPLLIFLTALLAYLPIPRKLDYWLGALSNVLPVDAYTLIDRTFHEIVSRQRGRLLSFSIFVAIWASSAGMEAIIGSINRAYRSTTLLRPWWREKLLSIFLTLGLAVFVLTALSLIFFGESLGWTIARFFGLGAAFKTAFGVAQWPLVSILILIGIDLVYYFAPNFRHKWKWFTPGAVFAVVCWLLISFGFRYYVSRFGNYNATYGALGGVMMLMLWFYLTGIAILIGGEINAITNNT